VAGPTADVAAPDEDPLAFASATELRGLIATRRVSPVELIEHILARIDRVSPVVNAYCTVAREQAIAAARKTEDDVVRGEALAPLHGVPVALKDMVPTAGIRTTFGSRLYAEHIPSEDALEASRLKQAGAIIVGKTNTPEFAAGPNTVNAMFGATRNPWDLRRSAGGAECRRALLLLGAGASGWTNETLACPRNRNPSLLRRHRQVYEHRALDDAVGRLWLAPDAAETTSSTGHSTTSSSIPTRLSTSPRGGEATATPATSTSSSTCPATTTTAANRRPHTRRAL